ncbi:MAG: T9SS type A sorting domain-containing protein [candidate division WOR-3 bacterium]|nr:T9SS type A sorting domain-containing protein [candidate division WOR-3 bacterium]
MKRIHKMSSLLAVVIPLSVQAAAIVPEFLVTTGGEVFADKRNITGSCNSSAQTVLAWLDRRDGGERYTDWPQTYVQYIDASGAPQGSNVRLNTGSDFRFCSASSSPALFNDGKALIATTRENRVDFMDHYENAVIRMWDTDAGFAAQPEAEFEIPIKMPVLAPYGDSFCLAVQNTPTTYLDTNWIEVQRFTRTGQLLGESFFVDTGSVQSVIVDDAGNFVIGYGPRYYRRYDKDGEPVGERVILDSLTMAFSLAGDPGGEILCCRIEADEDWNTYIYSQRFSASDEPVGPRYEIAQGAQTLAMTRGYNGEHLVVWRNEDTLYGRRLDASGAPHGQPFRINEPGAVDFTYYFWIGASEGRYHVTWIEDQMVYARPVLPTGTPGTQLRVCDDEPGVHAEWNEPVLAPDGRFFVHWKKSIGFHGESTAYLQHFDAGGNPDAQEWGADSFRWAYPSLGLDGKLYLSYRTTDEENLHAIWVQRFNRDGTPNGAPIEVGESDASSCYSTAVAVGDDGRGVVVWEEKVTNTDVLLFGQRFSVSGYKLGQPFKIDSFYSRRCLRVFKFADGGFVIGSNQTSAGEYMCYLYNSSAILERGPFRCDAGHSTQRAKAMGCNGVDRFVVLWMTVGLDCIYCQVFDRDGGTVGAPYTIDVPFIDENTNKAIYLGDYSPTVSMAPDGRFVITWKELDGLGNLSLCGKLFSRDGEPISAPFQVNDADQWSYSFQISGWRGVSAQNDRILFTWLENRRHCGWDVIAKVTDWDFPGVEEQPRLTQSPIQVSASLNRLFYDVSASVTGEASLTLYSADGRRILKETIQGKGIWEAPKLPSGVYFARVSTEGYSVRTKVVVIK